MRPHRVRILPVSFVLCLIAGAVAPAAAQPVPERVDPGQDAYGLPDGPDAPTAEAPPPAVSDVEGAAWLVRQANREALTAGSPLLIGDSVVTDRGRAELVWGDGSVLSVDEHSRVDLLSDGLVRLVDGRLRVELAVRDRDDARAAAESFRVDTADASLRLRDGGDYRIETASAAAFTSVAVLAGEAQAANGGTLTMIGPGERLTARAGEPFTVATFNVADWDAFDRWVDLRQRGRHESASAEHLPAEVQPYAPSFDVHGAWRDDATYGRVWYPHVEPEWRPYYDGGWHYYPAYGWTWVNASGWGWVTHHYGRWGFGVGGWYWIPARRWAPAWVYWAWTPSYVGWVPLGYYGRPVFAFGTWRHSYVHGYRHGYRDGFFDGRRAWSFVHWRHFGHKRFHHRHTLAVHDFHRLGSGASVGRALPRGVTRRHASHAAAVPRSPRGAHSMAVPRGSRSVAPETRAPTAHRQAGRVGQAVPRRAPAGAASSRPATVAPSRAQTVQPSAVTRSRASRAAPRVAPATSSGSTVRPGVSSPSRPSVGRSAPRATPSTRSVAPPRSPTVRPSASSPSRPSVGRSAPRATPSTRSVAPPRSPTVRPSAPSPGRSSVGRATPRRAPSAGSSSSPRASSSGSSSRGSGSRGARSRGGGRR